MPPDIFLVIVLGARIKSGAYPRTAAGDTGF